MLYEGADSLRLPGSRGRWLLWLEPPLITGSPRWVHFSWRGDSFYIRDYLTGMISTNHPNLTAVKVWQSAKGRIRCKGELYEPIQNFGFWKQKLEELTESDPR